MAIHPHQLPPLLLQWAATSAALAPAVHEAPHCDCRATHCWAAWRPVAASERLARLEVLRSLLGRQECWPPAPRGPPPAARRHPWCRHQLLSGQPAPEWPTSCSLGLPCQHPLCAKRPTRLVRVALLLFAAAHDLLVVHTLCLPCSVSAGRARQRTHARSSSRRAGCS